MPWRVYFSCMALLGSPALGLLTQKRRREQSVGLCLLSLNPEARIQKQNKEGREQSVELGVLSPDVYTRATAVSVCS